MHAVANTDIAVLVPIKAFSKAKARLAPALTSAERAALARWMAQRLIASAAPASVYVACDDDDVRGVAADHGATVVWTPDLGMNGALAAGIERIGRDGAAMAAIAHSDLPLADVGTLVEQTRARLLASAATASATAAPPERTVILVPDRRSDGTNIMFTPTARPVDPAYGAGSFHRHLQAAIHLGHAVTVHRDIRVALDVDEPHDLFHPLVRGILPSWLPTNPVNHRS
jgi:2-phospho-L-lactate/phosphoenolpyruvate guanylyltransferase